MESQRSFIAIGLLLVTFLLWQQWQIDNAPQPVQQTQTQSDHVPSTNLSAEAPGQDVPASDIIETVTSVSATLVEVTTDVLKVQIDTLGGDLVHAELLQHKTELTSEQPFILMQQKPGYAYVAQSGLVGRNGPDGSREGRPVYKANQTSYTLEGDTLSVPLTWTDGTGYTVTKTYTFRPGKYDVDVSYDIDNQTATAKQVQLYAQLKQSMTAEEGSMMMPTYRGGAYSTVDTRYKKYDFDDIQDANLNKTTEGGWVAYLQHYFVSAWVPTAEHTNQLYSLKLGNYAIMGTKGPVLDISANSQSKVSATLFVGPKDQEALKTIHDSLDLTVDYGWLFWLSQPLFSLLKWCYSITANWGLAIIIVTLIVRGAMYPLTKAQYTSMAKMRQLQPKMASIRERFGDDRQKSGQAMMELYKKEKVNPAGGCLPILLQMPIFLALYWVLLESVELRHAPFGLWITDLSSADPYYILPILMGASMWLLQKMQPMTMQDPMQQKIMMWMPVFMTVFFIWFPAGLVLYWLLSNVVSIIQAKFIYAQLDKKGLGHKSK